MIKKELDKLKNKKTKEILQKFFKTKKGEYGKGDIFLGIKVPVLRKVSNKYKDLSFEELQDLIDSKIHEYTMCALFILITKKEKGVKFYLKNTKRINNWDLVDLSAPKILGEYLQDRSILYKLAKSKNLWERRISIITTFRYIKDNDFTDTLKISEILLNDKHDLIHKAVGWMLREIGKRDKKVEEKFLKKYYKTMPRTMLRYAIEKFDNRQEYLKGLI